MILEAKPAWLFYFCGVLAGYRQFLLDSGLYVEVHRTCSRGCAGGGKTIALGYVWVHTNTEGLLLRMEVGKKARVWLSLFD